MSSIHWLNSDLNSIHSLHATRSAGGKQPIQNAPISVQIATFPEVSSPNFKGENRQNPTMAN
jgi:hypothetical protein